MLEARKSLLKRYCFSPTMLVDIIRVSGGADQDGRRLVPLEPERRGERRPGVDVRYSDRSTDEDRGRTDRGRVRRALPSGVDQRQPLTGPLAV